MRKCLSIDPESRMPCDLQLGHPGIHSSGIVDIIPDIGFGPSEEIDIIQQLVGEEKIDLNTLAIVLLELRERIRELEEK